MADDVEPASGAMAAVVAAELFEIEASFLTPYKLSSGTFPSTRAVMLKLTDADGLEGWGEANPKKYFTGESSSDAFAALETVLLPAVLAAPVPEPGRIDRALDTLLAQHLPAKGAISMALLDLLGKRLRVPVSTLLGGASRKSLPVLWPLSNGSAEEDIPVIETRAAQGFRTFMLKMGTSPVRDEIERVRLLEARFGREIHFIADANQGWTRVQASDFLAGVQGSNLAFVEQPVSREDPDGMAALAAGTRLPISADESVVTLADAAQVARLKAASIFSLKSSKNGGPLRAQRIAAVAEAFGIRCYMNSMTEFGITQAASLQHAVTVAGLVEVGHAFMSTLRLAEDPTDFGALVRNGVVELPERVGLGVQVDEEHVRRLSIAHRLLARTL